MTMIAPRILGLVALAALLATVALGRHVLGRDPGLRKAIGALLFCSVAGLATSFTRAPAVIWPLGIAMLGAMLFLVWTMRVQNRRQRS